MNLWILSHLICVMSVLYLVCNVAVPIRRVRFLVRCLVDFERANCSVSLFPPCFLPTQQLLDNERGKNTHKSSLTCGKVSMEGLKHPCIQIQWSVPQNSLSMHHKHPQPESQWMLQASPQDLIRLVKGWGAVGAEDRYQPHQTLGDPPLQPSTTTTLPNDIFPTGTEPDQITHTLTALLVVWLGWGMVGCLMSESVCVTVCSTSVCVCICGLMSTPTTALIDKGVRLQRRFGSVICRGMEEIGKGLVSLSCTYMG